MRGILLSAVLAVAVSAAAMQAGAQSSNEGILLVELSFSPDRDGALEPADCDLLIFSDLSQVRLPAGTISPRDTRLPRIASGRTERDGIAEFALPAGIYSLAVDNCQHDRDARGQGLTTGYTGRPCCWHPDGDPEIKILKDELGNPSFSAQHVEVIPGQTTALVFQDWGEAASPSRRTVWLIVALCLVIVLCGVAIASWLRGRYMPASDPVNAKRYEPPREDAERKPATFEDVFRRRE